MQIFQPVMSLADNDSSAGYLASSIFVSFTCFLRLLCSLTSVEQQFSFIDRAPT